MSHGVVRVINIIALIFTGWWLAAHVMRRIGDWEFWFALGYLLLCLVNVFHLARSPEGERTNGL